MKISKSNTTITTFTTFTKISITMATLFLASRRIHSFSPRRNGVGLSCSSMGGMGSKGVMGGGRFVDGLNGMSLSCSPPPPRSTNNINFHFASFTSKSSSSLSPPSFLNLLRHQHRQHNQYQSHPQQKEIKFSPLQMANGDTESNSEQTNPPKRRGDDYDTMFFVPANPKPSTNPMASNHFSSSFDSSSYDIDDAYDAGDLEYADNVDDHQHDARGENEVLSENFDDIDDVGNFKDGRNGWSNNSSPPSIGMYRTSQYYNQARELDQSQWQPPQQQQQQQQMRSSQQPQPQRSQNQYPQRRPPQSQPRQNQQQYQQRNQQYKQPQPQSQQYQQYSQPQNIQQYRQPQQSNQYQSGQPIQSDQDASIASIRALYQFHPLASNSQRELPPQYDVEEGYEGYEGFEGFEGYQDYEGYGDKNDYVGGFKEDTEDRKESKKTEKEIDEGIGGRSDALGNNNDSFSALDYRYGVNEDNVGSTVGSTEGSFSQKGDSIESSPLPPMPPTSSTGSSAASTSFIGVRDNEHTGQNSKNEVEEQSSQTEQEIMDFSSLQIDIDKSKSNSTPVSTASTASTASPDTASYPKNTARNTRHTPSFMEPEKTKSNINYNLHENNLETENENNNQNRNIPPETSNGNTITSHLTSLSHQLSHLQTQIYQLNNGLEFNINSPKQVARALFGDDGDTETSTNKDVLEAMASAGNELAGCIYKYRKLTREYKKELKRVEQLEKGDRKNDYYGNLRRLQERRKNGSGADGAVVEGSAVDAVGAVGGATAGSAMDGTNSNIVVEEKKEEFKVFETVTPKSQTQNKPKPHRRRREPLLLIDASAYIFRAYHALPPLHRSDGLPVGALHGVCRMLQNLLLNRLLKGDRPRVVLAFDSKRTNFRHDLYPEYKANRGPVPEDLLPQFDLVKEAARAMGVVIVEAEGYEADDVIATLAKRAVEEGVDVDILSGDKDLMQLITEDDIEPSVHMIDPMHFDRISHDDVISKWGVSSEKLGDVLALAGDSSDNIPGVPGIGPKIASSLINEYGSLNNLLEKAGKVKQQKRRESLLENIDKVKLFRQLVTLDDSIPTDRLTLPDSFESVSDLRMSVFDPSRLISFYKQMELNQCKSHLEKRLRTSWVDYKPPPSPEEYNGVPF